MPGADVGFILLHSTCSRNVNLERSVSTQGEISVIQLFMLISLKLKKKLDVWTALRTICLRGWRDGLEVKSIACSSKDPEFNSQQPHGYSQPSVTGSGALFCLQAYTE